MVARVDGVQEAMRDLVSVESEQLSDVNRSGSPMFLILGMPVEGASPPQMGLLDPEAIVSSCVVYRMRANH
jgi:hypothetical protein